MREQTKSLLNRLQETEFQLLKEIRVTGNFKSTLVKMMECLGLEDANSFDFFVWNSLSDPNLHENDYLALEDPERAQFKWVLSNKMILPVENIFDGDPKDSKIKELDASLRENHKQRIIYVVAIGEYEGKTGIHFCLYPSSDRITPVILKEVFAGVEESVELVIPSWFNEKRMEYALKYANHIRGTIFKMLRRKKPFYTVSTGSLDDLDQYLQDSESQTMINNNQLLEEEDESFIMVEEITDPD